MGHRCQCQRYKLRPGESFSSVPEDELGERLRDQSACDDPHSAVTSGLVAVLDGTPVGWCAVEPRVAYPALLRQYRVPWLGRAEDRLDGSVWAVTCFVTRVGYRRRGIAASLASAAVPFARDRGARGLEGYPSVSNRVIREELHVGTLAMFLDAGFIEVSRPTPRRAVVRIDF